MLLGWFVLRSKKDFKKKISTDYEKRGYQQKTVLSKRLWMAHSSIRTWVREITPNVFWWTMPNCYLQGLWAYEPLSEILKFACLYLGLGVVLNGIRGLTFPIICMQDCCKCRYNYLRGFVSSIYLFAGLDTRCNVEWKQQSILFLSSQLHLQNLLIMP